MPTNGDAVKYKFLSHTLYEQEFNNNKLDDNTFYVVNYPGTTIEQSGADYYLGKLRLTDIVILDEIPNLVPNKSGSNITSLIGSPYKIYIYYNTDTKDLSKGLNLYYFSVAKNCFVPFSSSTLVEFAVSGGLVKATMYDGTSVYMPRIDNSSLPQNGQYLTYNATSQRFVPETPGSYKGIIDDNTKATTTTYSSNKIVNLINTSVNNATGTKVTLTTSTSNAITLSNTVSGKNVAYTINHNKPANYSSISWTLSNATIKPNSSVTMMNSIVTDSYGHATATKGTVKFDFGGVYSTTNSSTISNTSSYVASNLVYYVNTTD